MTINVQTHRWSQLLQRLFIAKGGAGGAGLTVLDDVMPVIDLAGDNDSEYRRLRGEDLFCGYAAQAGGAGVNAIWQLVNGSTDRLVVIQSLTVFPSVTGNVGLRLFATAIGAPAGSAFNPDLRSARGLVPGQVPGTSVLVGTIAAPTGSVVRLVPCPSTALTEIVPAMGDIIVPPGQVVQLCPETQNVTFAVNVWGYARQVEPNELG